MEHIRLTSQAGGTWERAWTWDFTAAVIPVGGFWPSESCQGLQNLTITEPTYRWIIPVNQRSLHIMEPYMLELGSHTSAADQPGYPYQEMNQVNEQDQQRYVGSWRSDALVQPSPPSRYHLMSHSGNQSVQVKFLGSLVPHRCRQGAFRLVATISQQDLIQSGLLEGRVAEQLSKLLEFRSKIDGSGIKVF